jgi:translation elongation factor EF-Ts
VRDWPEHRRYCSFVKCREALVKFENDMDKCVAWLDELARVEGWTKAAK